MLWWSANTGAPATREQAKNDIRQRLKAGRVGYLAFGILLLLVGGTLSIVGVPLLLAPGWVSIALGAILVTAHVAVGPTRAA